MRIISWNVNGFRACLKKGFMEFLAQSGTDMFCVQETKMQQGRDGVDLSGQYMDYWNSAEKKGYSGTLTLTKVPPMSVSCGMGISEHDNEGRIITLEFDGFYLVNVYTPNAQRELARLDYRMLWEDAFREYVCRLDENKPVIICGDLNVAHKEIDLKHAKSNEGNPGYTRQERDKLTMLLDMGFTDIYRHLYPEKKDAYTWWSYIGNAREKNIGWRIDYFIISNRLTDKVSDAFICADIYGSDHCPVGLEIN